MSERERKYQQDYHKNIRRPKTLADRAVAKATCEICGDEWANTQAGWNDAIFACDNCAGKLSNWDREKEDWQGGNAASRVPGLLCGPRNHHP